MARKEMTIEIMDRERALTFKLKEMPATRLESWILRAVLLLASARKRKLGQIKKDSEQVKNSPEQVKQDFDQMKASSAQMNTGEAYISEQLIFALGELDYEKTRPLLDELLSCCSIVIDRVEKRLAAEFVDDHIQDVNTLFRLKLEAARLNLGSLGLPLILGMDIGRLFGFSKSKMEA